MHKKILITGSYSLLTRECVEEVSRRLNNNYIVTLGVIPSQYFNSDYLISALKIILSKSMQRGDPRIHFCELDKFDAINNVNFSPTFFECIKVPQEKLKLEASKIFKGKFSSVFIGTESFYWAEDEHIDKLYIKSVMHEFSRIVLYEDLIEKLCSVKALTPMTYWDFSKEERETWTMCPDCMPSGPDKNCGFCSGTGIDTNAPNYTGPCMRILEGC